MEMHTKKRLFKRVNIIGLIFFMLAFLTLSGCSTKSVTAPQAFTNAQPRIDSLARDITRLSPFIDPAEARQAATIAIKYSFQLAEEYEITRSPIMHNFLINVGLKERGLCIHWTEDLQKRLLAEQMRSLEFHWAVANYEKPFRLEHSSVVVTPVGGKIKNGILLDPWRNAGHLYWSQTKSDEGYQWYPREEVRQKKLAQRERLVPQPTTR